MAKRSFVFVGCLNREAPYFQGAKGKGIGAFAFDGDNGAATKVGEVEGVDNPSYLSVHPGTGCVYATSEVFGWNEGTVSAYRFDPESGRLTYLNKQPTLGAIAAHSSFDRTGRFLLVANYSLGGVDDLPGKSIAVFPLREDGGVDPVVASAAYSGTGPDPARQERSHAHCILPSPDNRFVVVADLGIDKMIAHSFDATTGALGPAVMSDVAPGAGPRHFVFHPNGRLIVVINELDSTVCSLSWDAATGRMAVLDTASALPGVIGIENHCSGLQMSADGRFVYGANRGHDSIAAYSVDADSGKLDFLGFTPTGGATPRDHVIDPSGRFLLVCNQNGDSVTIFRIDPETGALTDTGQAIATGTPMCAKFGLY